MNVEYSVGQRRTLLFASAGLAVLLAACNNPQPTDQQVQQKAAETTATVKQGAKEAAAATQAAAAAAERKLDDVAAGVKQGMQEDGPHGDGQKIDLNHASRVRLATLPGISLDKAGDIVKGRPYRSAHQLVSRGLLTQEELARIAPQITVTPE